MTASFLQMYYSLLSIRIKMKIKEIKQYRQKFFASSNRLINYWFIMHRKEKAFYVDQISNTFDYVGLFLV